MTPAPTRIDDLTIDWLAEVFGAPGQLRSFDAKMIGAGVGLVGSIARIEMQWDCDHAPATAVVKFPALGDESRFVAMVLRMYEREVRSYEQLTDRSPIGSACRYYSTFDPSTHDFTLVIEELRGDNPDQVEGCTEPRALLAVERLAEHHAAFWEDGGLDELAWLPSLDDPQIVPAVQIAFQGGWSSLAPQVDDLATPEIVALCERFPGLIPGLMRHLSQPPFTLAHGDYRLDNMFFHEREFALCDWQLVCRARGPYDLAYFTTQSLNVEHRRAWEPDLLARYYSVLTTNGVTNYSVADLADDYRVATLFCLVYPVIAGGSLTVADDRHIRLCRALFERCSAAIADLECLDLVARFVA
jgi:hypothetical protein